MSNYELRITNYEAKPAFPTPGPRPPIPRVILDPPLPGDWNMAVDEAILHAVAAGGPTTLRLYRWERPTLSLGYFQRYAERSEHPASLSCRVVRRATGGGAIVHDRELTYSLCVPIADRAAASAAEYYRWAHRSLIEVFESFGLACATWSSVANSGLPGTARAAADNAFLCFERRSEFDLVAPAPALSRERPLSTLHSPLSTPCKLVGSAQRRLAGALLQHGSILLARSPQAPQLPGGSECLGSPIEPDEFAGRWLGYLSQRTACEWEPGVLMPSETRLAAAIRQEKFAAQAWTCRR